VGQSVRDQMPGWIGAVQLGERRRRRDDVTDLVPEPAWPVVNQPTAPTIGAAATSIHCHEFRLTVMWTVHRAEWSHPSVRAGQFSGARRCVIAAMARKIAPGSHRTTGITNHTHHGIASIGMTRS
jgi:hypothetical protein